MKLLSHGPEPCASANSAIPAKHCQLYILRFFLSSYNFFLTGFKHSVNIMSVARECWNWQTGMTKDHVRLPREGSSPSSRIKGVKQISDLVSRFFILLIKGSFPLPLLFSPVSHNNSDQNLPFAGPAI